MVKGNFRYDYVDGMRLSTIRRFMLTRKSKFRYNSYIQTIYGLQSTTLKNCSDTLKIDLAQFESLKSKISKDTTNQVIMIKVLF